MQVESEKMDPSGGCLGADCKWSPGGGGGLTRGRGSKLGSLMNRIGSRTGRKAKREEWDVRKCIWIISVCIHLGEATL